MSKSEEWELGKFTSLHSTRLHASAGSLFIEHGFGQRISLIFAAMRVCAFGAPLMLASLGAAAPCHRISDVEWGGFHSCYEASDPSSCETSADSYSPGTCAGAGYGYCFQAPGPYFPMEGWVSADQCGAAVESEQKAGFSNDGCGGKSLPCPAGLTSVIV